MSPYMTPDEQAAEQERAEEFMRTHVSRYVLPGKLAAAQRKGAATVSVPTADMARLLARVGEHIAPVTEPDAPTIPESVRDRIALLDRNIDWNAEDRAEFDRDAFLWNLDQVARIAFEAPRPVRRSRPAATVTEKVAAAIAASKRAVTVPTADLARMLDTVDAERHTLKENAA